MTTLHGGRLAGVLFYVMEYQSVNTKLFLVDDTIKDVFVIDGKIVNPKDIFLYHGEQYYIEGISGFPEALESITSDTPTSIPSDIESKIRRHYFTGKF